MACKAGEVICVPLFARLGADLREAVVEEPSRGGSSAADIEVLARESDGHADGGDAAPV